MAGVVAHPELPLDEIRHARARPQRSLVAELLGTFQQQFLQALSLPGIQQWQTSGSPRGPQALLAALL